MRAVKYNTEFKTHKNRENGSSHTVLTATSHSNRMGMVKVRRLTKDKPLNRL